MVGWLLLLLLYKASVDDGDGKENVHTNSFIKGYDKSLVSSTFYKFLSKELYHIMTDKTFLLRSKIFDNLSVTFGSRRIEFRCA